jgi:methylmalonyl-CoA mutase cobalamin-binding domain/chain
MYERPIRFVLAKLGLDDHIRPLNVLSYALRDAGIEVIYLGCFQTPQMVVEIAAVEDADSIGLSFHTTSYFGWIDETMNLLKEKKMDDRVSPPEDTGMLKDIGVSGVFLPGTALSQVTDQIKKTVAVIRERKGLA